jgi:chromosome segregation protein
MRFLKRLQLQGYKTFATRTEFQFDEGVTAIVGPNGSGKSNVSDSLRWVLGEQSYGALRGKRTEDMIFSGSEQRPRMGMAYVTLTLDNATGWLPIDFAEVEIGRRAYRSGENEYYLNGNRVRLRDIMELLGHSGLSERTYSMVGQGLIDQALSQRPEERRKLFEEAAGITVHQDKRAQAERQLADARVNLTRAQDIISELTPRLRYLKGQARRAQEFQQIRADLQAHLKVWYGYRWGQELAELAAAHNRLTDACSATDEQTEALNALVEQATAYRTERVALRDKLTDWHRSSSRLHRDAEGAQRELAVRTEQARLLGEQAEELRREIVHLRAALEDGAARLDGANAELAAATAAYENHAAQVTTAERELGEREQQRKAQARRVSQAEEAILTLKAQQVDRQARLAQLDERRAELGRAQAEQAQATQTAAAQLAELEGQLGALAEKIKTSQTAAASLEHERTTQAAALAAAQQAERAAREALSAAQRSMARLQDQHDMLERLRDEGAGLAAGPRSVLAAVHRSAPEKSGTDKNQRPRGDGPMSERPSLTGIVGALGDLIETPPELEKAIEAALGGRLQDIVVERWQDAESAVAFLKQTQGGRATFLPLDTLRTSRPADAPRMAGVLGLASELVRFDPHIRPAVELALNHIVIVQDLPTARRLLRGNNDRGGSATLVTVDGEIVRSSGSVTGGSEGNRRDSGLLARARTLRELPPQIEATAAQVKAREAEVADAAKRGETAQAALSSLRLQQRDAAATVEKLGADRNRLQLAVERARQNIAWHTERGQQATQELAQLAGRETDLQTGLARLTEQLTQADAAALTARRELAGLATDDLVGGLARLRAQAEVSAAQRQSLQSQANELRRLQRQRADDIAAKETRIETLGNQQTAATQAIATHGASAHQLASEIAALTAQIDPAEARLAQIEGEQRNGETRERSLRDQLRHAQMRQSQAELALQRAQDNLAHLREEIEKELGLVDLEGEELAGSQQPLPLNGMITHLPTVAELPEGLDNDVRNLRAQINRLGPVNLEALNEYTEVETRYEFLTTQSADLQKAAAALEEVIAELDRVMEREFLSTFKAIAGQFKEEFLNLFGGGAARLVLTDPDNPNTTGVEIIARPPGKREQGLSLLSGGERALTAAALVFSILKVRPTPFCVLDEVDAALDEANVGRFRDALKALSEQTQFLLITHNRGTIEAADTIYGISMGSDNTSQMLSLKLDGQDLAVDSALEPASDAG